MNGRRNLTAHLTPWLCIHRQEEEARGSLNVSRRDPLLSIPNQKGIMAIHSQDSNIVAGYFPSEQKAETALRALHEAGFRPDQIGIAGHMRPQTATQEPEHGFWHRTRSFFGGGEKSAAPITGAAQPLTGVEGGPESSGYYSVDATDFHGTLTGLSLPEERSHYFSGRFGRETEGVLVTVNAGTRKREAESILRANDADLGEDFTSRPAEGIGATATRPGAETGPVTETQRMQLYGEVLRVHRDRVQSGEVRLRKETVTENKTLNVPVSHEELVLERRPVTDERPAPGAEIGKDREVRIPLTQERVSVEKQPVVREEVEVGKKEITDVESRDEKVRREELKVEDERQKEAERLRKAS